MSDDIGLVWFRRDLRVLDNEALSEASTHDRVIPVYCFDPRHYGEQAFGGSNSFRFEKTGGHRTRFRREAVADLRERLRRQGSDLVVRRGRPETEVPAVADAVDADSVYFHTFPTPEEVTVENRLKQACRDHGYGVRRFWGHTLYHINDLPTPYTEISDTYTSFRKSVESDGTVREVRERPSLPALPGAGVEPGSIPDPADLGVGSDSREQNGPRSDGDIRSEDRSVLGFEGGESAGLDRVQEYIWENDRLREYKETRNGMLGADYSSKFSAWLNEGCLSPRYIKEEIDRYEDRRVANESTYWLVFELIWRDFFAFQFAKHGATFFTQGGIRERTDIDWRIDATALERWKSGETGIPFVDANMRELNRTGYMSNRGRQNVASFLANNLRLDWRKGAAYFETQLVDYDPCSNYGNWAYIAGVGNDSRDRYFNIIKQARRYDPEAAYVKHWLPILDPLPPEYAHEPWTMTEEKQADYGIELGVDYPEPMIDLDASYEKLR